MSKEILEIIRERILVFDGATGTNLQRYKLNTDDFGGKQYEGCNEYLCITRPEIVFKLHTSFLQAGADVIETNSFGSSSIVLSEYGLEESDYELNFKSAKIAKEAASEYSTKSKPRFVAGSAGPTTKLPSLGHISFDKLQESYYRQMSGLYDGGVDLLCIETCQDMLQIKCALYAAQRIFEEKKRKIPLIISFTIESTGTMLMGTDISAALTTFECYNIADIIGMNCATGPKEMEENVRYLSQNSPKPIFIMPNAGLPENIGDEVHYHLTPEELEKWMYHFTFNLGVNIIGGCCGTTPEHIKKLVELSENISPVKRKVEYTHSVSSMFTSVPLQITPAPVFIGERCNANGSKQFKELLEKDDFDSMIDMAKSQLKEGAHILDISVAYTGRNEKKDIAEVIKRFNSAIQAPLMIDSTEVSVIEEGLKHYGGRAIINSVNFEEGTEKANMIFRLAKQYGAAVICLSIDEDGQAYTLDRKVSIARRIRDYATKIHGLRDEDLIFDPLTFPLGSGAEELRDSGKNTIEAIRQIKNTMPMVKTSIGLSNCSFGLNQKVRHILNSVFLHYAIEAGLDMCIVHAGKIIPLYKIDEKGRELCRQLIFDERKFADI